MRGTAWFVAAVLAAALCPAACSTGGISGPGGEEGPADDTGSRTDSGFAADAGTDAGFDSGAGVEDAGPGTISIYLTGDFTPRTFEDGLSGQTPADYVIALSKYFIQTSMDDPSPVFCFDHGEAAAAADLSRDNLMGVCPTESIPTASYTHGRVKVDWARYTVAGTLHYTGQSLPGEFTFFRAYSDVSYEGHAYAAGEGTAQFSGSTTTEVPATFPPIPPIPGLRMETIAGEFWLTFPYSRPLLVVQGNEDQHWARFFWEVFEAFRWEDRQSAGYLEGVWDVSTAEIDTETVVNPGATGYHVTASTD
ncbi:MAG: hypothetical protein HY897_00715 [Deltaproteobacteria bacterium]|nr:hypothetical protein [Deltaproteobacteria bacterium]